MALNAKRRKYSHSDGTDSDSSSSSSEQSDKNDPEYGRRRSTKIKRNEPLNCSACRQILDDSELQIFPGDPYHAQGEDQTLVDASLSFVQEVEEDTGLEKPQLKITDVSVYDRFGHLCRLDMGLLESNVKLYCSGWVKAINDDDPSTKDGIATRRIGPIVEWWLSGYDGGESILIGVSTDAADYYIMKPSAIYEPYLDAMKEKIYLSKLVIEYLDVNPTATYEDLVNKVQNTAPPQGLTNFSENSLLRHAQFIVNQIRSYDAAAKDDDILLFSTPCVTALINLVGCFIDKPVTMNGVRKDIIRPKKLPHSLATTTPLVFSMFETTFDKQIDKESNVKHTKQHQHVSGHRKRCQVCEACQRNDCGNCTPCRNMIKFGGSGKNKQWCVKRRCPYIKNLSNSSEDDEIEIIEIPEVPEITLDEVISDEALVANQRSHRSHNSQKQKTKLIWVGDVIMEESQRKYYAAVMINDEMVKWGDTLFVAPEDPSTPLFIARVIYMWESPFGEKKFHAHWFTRGSDTVLGETADNCEVFVVYECEDSNLEYVTGKCTVVHQPPKDWLHAKREDAANVKTEMPDGEKIYFYQKLYVPLTARFEDPPSLEILDNRNDILHLCVSCKKIIETRKQEIPKLGRILQEVDGKIYYHSVRWRKEKFRVGECVFLLPEAFQFNAKQQAKKISTPKEDYDEEIYTERYRKNDVMYADKEQEEEPFRIGYIKSVYVPSGVSKLSRSFEIRLVVKKFYRPENTHRNGSESAQQADLNLLYWSDEEATVKLKMVQGKCYVVYKDNLKDDVDEYASKGPYRFYFSKSYVAEIKCFRDPPPFAQKLGKVDLINPKKRSIKYPYGVPMETYPEVKRPLRALDVFAGCGGLSQGLHQSGITETFWAIDFEESAARAFQLNNRDCLVFVEDCNTLLKLVMDGETHTSNGLRLPQKGDVEFLCGGPPCQGFSCMNQFKSRQYSLFKNSLVVTFLSYCDYYRPRFFLLENVRNFTIFKKSMVLKLTLACLVKMGYQCTFGVLEAGRYGVPQTRKRAFILAAAPGEVLPLFPEPSHVFNYGRYSMRRCSMQTSTIVDDRRFFLNCTWNSSAPYRMITVRDSMSDLPAIRSGNQTDELPYGGKAQSHFQRLMRGKDRGSDAIVRDHVCKEMSPLIEARLELIPTTPGSDWRDLPNIRMELADGTWCKKLRYSYHDKKNGKSRYGALRGVCSCAEGKPCDPMAHQDNTLIPWCLPHTGNRHNNWSGLYGRIAWDSYFKTTVTNPEPMGKQGRVVHPEQNRVVSVRECARSQGFPDSYRFVGTVLDRHRQVGNAVPPPLAAAIGMEIRKAVALKEKKKEDFKIENGNYCLKDQASSEVAL